MKFIGNFTFQSLKQTNNVMRAKKKEISCCKNHIKQCIMFLNKHLQQHLFFLLLLLQALILEKIVYLILLFIATILNILLITHTIVYNCWCVGVFNTYKPAIAIKRALKTIVYCLSVKQ